MNTAALAAAFIGWTANCGLTYADHANRTERPSERRLLKKTVKGMSAEELGTAGSHKTRRQRKSRKE